MSQPKKAIARPAKLKIAVARKANHELDPKQDSELEQELQVARYLASAFIAQSHGIGMDCARKKYAQMPVGAFWIGIARQVIAHTAQRGGQPEFRTAIQ